MMLKDKLTAIVLAAGLGTRMKSSQAKVLHEILGRPMLAYLIDTLKSVGVADIHAVVVAETTRWVVFGKTDLRAGERALHTASGGCPRPAGEGSSECAD